MKSLAATCLLLAVALSACAGSSRHGRHERRPAGAGSTQISTRRVSSSRLILGGRVRCTATATTPVEAGHEIGLTFSLHNVSGSTARASVEEGSVWLVVRAGDGTTYNTRTAARAQGSLGGPYRVPVAIPAGATKTLGSPSVSVRWKGPLRVTPGCEQKLLPALQVKVAAPGPPPDEPTAIDDVVAATGHLLDRCRPEKSGVAVEGQIDPPEGSGPPMGATCSASLHSEGRFVVAQVLVLIPAGLRGVHVRQPYETLSFKKERRPYEAIAWALVVTNDGATTVAGSMRDATRAANRMAPGWVWSGSRWSGPDTGRCGYEGLTGGPAIDWISVCP